MQKKELSMLTLSITTIRKLVISLLIVGAMVQTSSAMDKVARCEISTSGKVTFKGNCLFSAEQDGSFSLWNIQKDKELIEGVSIISVSIIDKGVADVRGLTSDGINSRWGEAKRSQKDKACWQGSGFKICVR